MEKRKIESLFSGEKSNSPKCPSCGGQAIVIMGSTVLCSTCEWFSRIDKNNPIHTSLTRWALAKATKTVADNQLHYFYMSGGDNEERSLFLKRTFERVSNIEDGLKMFEIAKFCLEEILASKQFERSLNAEDGLVHPLYLAVHSRRPTPSVDEIGGIAIDPINGSSTLIGKRVIDVIQVPRPVSIDDGLSDSTLTEFLAAMGSWDLAGERGCAWSSVMKVTPIESVLSEDKIASIEVDDSIGEQGGRIFEVVYLTYNYYPRRILVAITNDRKVVSCEGFERFCHSNICQFGDKQNLLRMDSIFVQPVLWSAINFSHGDGSKNFFPRYVSVFGSKEFSMTCCVSESMDTGEICAKASVRNNEGAIPEVLMKTIAFDTVDQCIKRIDERVEEYKSKIERSVVFKKSWNDMETDPFVAAFEIRNMGFWRDSVAMEAVMGRRSSVFL